MDEINNVNLGSGTKIEANTELGFMMKVDASSVVQPTEQATDIYEVSLAILAACSPAGGVLKASLDILVRKRMEKGQRTLIDELRKHGIEQMSNEKWEYFIPAAYRFYEQIRIGEYDHNLLVLAKMIASGTSEMSAKADVGSVARTARKLELLPKPFLFALSRCQRAFEIYEASDESNKYWICINDTELTASFAEVGEHVTPFQCNEWLHELASRGILTAGGRPSKISGTYYFKNQVYNEVMEAVGQLSKSTWDATPSNS